MTIHNRGKLVGSYPEPPDFRHAWLVIFVLICVMALTACSPESSEPSPARAIDGDTIAVGDGYGHESHITIRLQHIDAPEMPGHCNGYRAENHTCAPGDPFASQQYLQFLLDQGPLFCIDDGKDVYHRRLATCTVRDIDLSQAMLEAHMAVPYYYHGERQ